jgi:MarR family transcriptional regulator for hemolysin
MEEPIGLFVTRAAKALSRAFDGVLVEQGGNLASWLVLASLAGGLRATQRALAADLGIEGATLTHHLGRLEAAGLVRRERVAENRRAQQVELTDAGRAEFAVMLSAVQGFDQRLRDGFTDDELTTLRTLLQRLAANATASDPTAPHATAGTD